MRTILLVLLAVMHGGCERGLIAKPKASDLVGVYSLSRESREVWSSGQGYGSLYESEIEVKPDMTLEMRSVPDCIFSGHGISDGRLLTGVAKGEIAGGSLGYALDLHISGSGSLPSGVYLRWILLRLGSPIDLEFTIGDPDQGQRIRYVRRTG